MVLATAATALEIYLRLVHAGRPTVVVFYRAERSRFCRSWIRRWLHVPALGRRLSFTSSALLLVSAQSQGKAYSLAEQFVVPPNLLDQSIFFIGDPTHELARYLSEADLLHPIVTNPDGHRAHAWVYDHGMVQPAVVAVCSNVTFFAMTNSESLEQSEASSLSGARGANASSTNQTILGPDTSLTYPVNETVLFAWAMRPSFRNAGGKLERPDPWEVWDYVERKLDRMQISEKKRVGSLLRQSSLPLSGSGLPHVRPTASSRQRSVERFIVGPQGNPSFPVATVAPSTNILKSSGHNPPPVRSFGSQQPTPRGGDNVRDRSVTDISSKQVQLVGLSPGPDSGAVVRPDTGTAPAQIDAQPDAKYTLVSTDTSSSSNHNAKSVVFSKVDENFSSVRDEPSVLHQGRHDARHDGMSGSQQIIRKPGNGRTTLESVMLSSDLVIPRRASVDLATVGPRALQADPTPRDRIVKRKKGPEDYQIVQFDNREDNAVESHQDEYEDDEFGQFQRVASEVPVNTADIDAMFNKTANDVIDKVESVKVSDVSDNPLQHTAKDITLPRESFVLRRRLASHYVDSVDVAPRCAVSETESYYDALVSGKITSSRPAPLNIGLDMSASGESHQQSSTGQEKDEEEGMDYVEVVVRPDWTPPHGAGGINETPLAKEGSAFDVPARAQVVKDSPLAGLMTGKTVDIPTFRSTESRRPGSPYPGKRLSPGVSELALDDEMGLDESSRNVEDAEQSVGEMTLVAVSSRSTSLPKSCSSRLRDEYEETQFEVYEEYEPIVGAVCGSTTTTTSATLADFSKGATDSERDFGDTSDNTVWKSKELSSQSQSELASASKKASVACKEEYVVDAAVHRAQPDVDRDLHGRIRERKDARELESGAGRGDDGASSEDNPDAALTRKDTLGQRIAGRLPFVSSRNYSGGPEKEKECEGKEDAAGGRLVRMLSSGMSIPSKISSKHNNSSSSKRPWTKSRAHGSDAREDSAICHHKAYRDDFDEAVGNASGSRVQARAVQEVQGISKGHRITRFLSHRVEPHGRTSDRQPQGSEEFKGTRFEIETRRLDLSELSRSNARPEPVDVIVTVPVQSRPDGAQSLKYQALDAGQEKRCNAVFSKENIGDEASNARDGQYTRSLSSYDREGESSDGNVLKRDSSVANCSRRVMNSRMHVSSPDECVVAADRYSKVSDNANRLERMLFSGEVAKVPKELETDLQSNFKGLEYTSDMSKNVDTVSSGLYHQNRNECGYRPNSSSESSKFEAIAKSFVSGETKESAVTEMREPYIGNPPRQNDNGHLQQNSAGNMNPRQVGSVHDKFELARNIPGQDSVDPQHSADDTGPARRMYFSELSRGDGKRPAETASIDVNPKNQEIGDSSAESVGADESRSGRAVISEENLRHGLSASQLGVSSGTLNSDQKVTTRPLRSMKLSLANPDSGIDMGVVYNRRSFHASPYDTTANGVQEMDAGINGQTPFIVPSDDDSSRILRKNTLPRKVFRGTVNRFPTTKRSAKYRSRIVDGQTDQGRRVRHNGGEDGQLTRMDSLVTKVESKLPSRGSVHGFRRRRTAHNDEVISPESAAFDHLRAGSRRSAFKHGHSSRAADQEGEEEDSIHRTHTIAVCAKRMFTRKDLNENLLTSHDEVPNRRNILGLLSRSK